jgi:hypothetical protein
VWRSLGVKVGILSGTPSWSPIGGARVCDLDEGVRAAMRRGQLRGAAAGGRRQRWSRRRAASGAQRWSVAARLEQRSLPVERQAGGLGAEPMSQCQPRAGGGGGGCGAQEEQGWAVK